MCKWGVSFYTALLCFQDWSVSLWFSKGPTLPIGVTDNICDFLNLNEPVSIGTEVAPDPHITNDLASS